MSHTQTYKNRFLSSGIPGRIWLVAGVSCLAGSWFAWELVSMIRESGVVWNPLGFMLPVGVILVMVRKTPLIPDHRPKILLFAGVVMTLSGFFIMMDNYQRLSSGGGHPQPGAILLPLGIGLLFRRPFCRAFLRLIIMATIIGSALYCLGMFDASAGPVQLNTSFSDGDSDGSVIENDTNRALLPGIALILLGVLADRALYSRRSQNFFSSGAGIEKNDKGSGGTQNLVRDGIKTA